MLSRRSLAASGLAFAILVGACTTTESATTADAGSTSDASSTPDARSTLASPTDEDASVVPVGNWPDTNPDGGPYCTTPLTDAGPSTVDDSAVAALCAANPGRVKEWATPCGPYLALSVAVGVDCDRQYVFDAASRQLVAVVAGCNGEEQCVQGDSRFVPPVDPDGGFHGYHCLEARVFADVCPDAGVAPDAATAEASTDTD